MASETNLSGVRASPDQKGTIRSAAGSSGASSARPIPPVAPINAAGQTFAQLAHSNKPDKQPKPQSRDNEQRSKEPGNSLLSDGAQFLLAETRMQEAHAMFPATSKIAPAHNAYNEIQNQIKLSRGQL